MEQSIWAWLILTPQGFLKRCKFATRPVEHIVLVSVSFRFLNCCTWPWQAKDWSMIHVMISHITTTNTGVWIEPQQFSSKIIQAIQMARVWLQAPMSGRAVKTHLPGSDHSSHGFSQISPKKTWFFKTTSQGTGELFSHIFPYFTC